MSLQGYYLVISILGWYWWVRGAGLRAQGDVNHTSKPESLTVTRIKLKTGIVLAIVFLVLYFIMWFALDKLTDSPVPEWDSFITSLSIIATWMLARKIYEHWFLWIVVNIAASILFFTRALYPTVILYIVYCAMSFVGLIEWKKSLIKNQ
jgi:nicotinamide mononucleotide transporter